MRKCMHARSYICTHNSRKRTVLRRVNVYIKLTQVMPCPNLTYIRTCVRMHVCARGRSRTVLANERKRTQINARKLIIALDVWALSACKYVCIFRVRSKTFRMYYKYTHTKAQHSHTHIQIHEYACMHTDTRMQALNNIYTYVHTNAQRCIHTITCTYIHTHVCKRLHMHAHTHTHTHTHIQPPPDHHHPPTHPHQATLSPPCIMKSTKSANPLHNLTEMQ